MKKTIIIIFLTKLKTLLVFCSLHRWISVQTHLNF